MCGITGYVGGPRSSEHTVQGMLASLARRGPDSEGIEAWPAAVLGHRRLAILDLSDAGRQPMLSDDGEIGVVFNGCIYNFLDIRAELEQRGHHFRSQCDTEVLVRGYQEWGIDALARRLRGMFAFAVWDNPRGKLTLVRDRLGVKPLVYCARGNELAFASTVRALHEAGFGGAVNPQAVMDVLEYGWVNDERAIFEGLDKLPPGAILEWSGGQISLRSYWSLSTIENPAISFDEAVEETERLILESVRLRLISDVPVGALLSGGVDSALVCWAMREANADITAFTVRAPGDASDESAAAARTAQLLGIRHEIVDMPDAHTGLDTLIEAYSEPFACSSAQGLLLVSEAVKRHATVLLTGDGGDDVFLGYPFFRHAWMAQKLARRLPRAATPVWSAIRGLVPEAGPARRMRSFLDYATGGLGAFAAAHDGLPYFESGGMLGERLAGRQLAQRHGARSADLARRLLAEVFDHHRRLHFTSEFMTKVDGGTMYYALEARAPFLDQELWEFATSLPAGVRLRGGVLKAVLRAIVDRRVGSEVAARGKQGFTIPVERWLADRWSGALDHLRGETILEREGWIRRGALAEPLERAIRQRSIPVQIWRLLILELWLSRYAEPRLGGAQSAPSLKAAS